MDELWTEFNKHVTYGELILELGRALAQAEEYTRQNADGGVPGDMALAIGGLTAGWHSLRQIANDQGRFREIAPIEVTTMVLRMVRRMSLAFSKYQPASEVSQ